MNIKPNTSGDAQEGRRKLRRTARILPSLFTTANLFCGFFGIMSILDGHYDLAARAIGIAIILDALDGRLARMAKTTSDFGLQLDSLADVVSFGVAPAVLLATWGLSSVPELGWFTAFIFLTAGAMRLARFNITTSSLKHFVGMPIPAAAGVIAAIVHFFRLPVRDDRAAVVLALLGFSLALLMVSKLKYPSPKTLHLARGKSTLNVLLLGTVIAAIWYFSRPLLLMVASGYFLSGILLKIYSLARSRTAEEPHTKVD